MAGLLHFPFGFRAEAVLMFFPCDCFKKNEAAKLINIFSITIDLFALFTFPCFSALEKRKKQGSPEKADCVT